MAAPQAAQNFVKKLASGELLFKEGDTPDAMYVVKRGRLIVFKQKGSSEVELAQISTGQMVGEMAFF
jgi:CRP-like cAMP-binding protein